MHHACPLHPCLSPTSGMRLPATLPLRNSMGHNFMTRDKTHTRAPVPAIPTAGSPVHHRHLHLTCPCVCTRVSTHLAISTSQAPSPSKPSNTARPKAGAWGPSQGPYHATQTLYILQLQFVTRVTINCPMYRIRPLLHCSHYHSSHPA